jgi:glycosyltransferase involved in cell wall biosynthesis
VTIREGFQEAPELARALAGADVVALPYALAGASGVLLLAYGASRPVVAYPVGGLAEAVVDGETGWLCARPDPAALAATLEAIVAAGRDECRRRGAAGERLARERWSWEAMATATAEVYDRSSARTSAE